MAEFWNSAPKGFRRLNDIVLIQNDVLTQISGQPHTILTGEKTITEYIKQKELEDLDEFRDIIAKKEQSFYQRLKISGYQELKEKVDRWNATGAYQMLKDEHLIDQIYNVFAKAKYSDLISAVTILKENYPEKVANILLDTNGLVDELESLGLYLENVVQSGLKGGSSLRRGTISVTIANSNNNPKIKTLFSNSNYIFLNDKFKGITLTQRVNGNIEIHFTQNIPAATQKQLVNLIQEILKKNKNSELKHTTQSDINNQICNLIKKYLINTGNSDILSLVQNKIITNVIQDFMVDSQQINIEQTRSTIRGALGEIYWTAFFLFIGLRTTPVGMFTSQEYNIKNKNTSPKQIPVDIVFEGCGAQVKNYTVNNGIVSFNSYFKRETEEMIPKTQNLYNFLVGRGGGLHMNARNARVIYGRYYFAEQYNRRYIDKTKDGKEIGDVDGVYEVIEKRFQPISRGIETYFKNCIDKMLKINYDVQLDEKSQGLLTENEQDFDAGKPTFFIINHDIFPVTYIIDEIKKNLQDIKDDKILSITVENFEVRISNAFSDPISATYPQPAKPTIEKGLSESEITYSVEVNVDELVKHLCDIK